jgi:hypothetical protein
MALACVLRVLDLVMPENCQHASHTRHLGKEKRLPQISLGIEGPTTSWFGALELEVALRA